MGKIVNGRFEGPGKYKQNGIDEQENTLEVCRETLDDMYGYKIGNITGQQTGSQMTTRYVKIVCFSGFFSGNFKDGYPHGLVKFENSNNTVIIAQMYRGVMHGLYRLWNTEGNLSQMGYMHNGKSEGKCWQRQETTNE